MWATARITFGSTMQPPAFVDHEKFFDCVHCGLCLASCPTYVELGTEPDSPRGRIALLRGLQEGRTQLTDEVVHHLDLCLGCRACETACPSGVQYGALIEGARPFVEQYHTRPFGQRLKRWAMNTLFPRPWGARLFALMLRLGGGLGFGRLARWQWLPARLRYWLGLLPARGDVSGVRLDERYAPTGERRARVALLSGCVMSAVFGATNRATVKVLRHNGCEVLVPKDQGCCGALLLHNGDKQTALELAKHNVDVFGKLEVDALLVNAAGCGAMMKEYAELLKDEPAYHERAARLTEKMQDVAEFLDGLGLHPPTREVRATAAYHDACHLAHGQGVRDQPRALLSAIPGLTLTPLPESDWCCGSAGTYNLTQPDMAVRLLERKIGHIQTTGADLVVTGNPGCLMQIRAGLQQRDLPTQAVHTLDLLAGAYDD